MADNRKYYYLKLKENFFDSDSIVLLEDMKDGILYSNILLKLYLKSLKNGGKLQLDEHIPYTAQMIASDCLKLLRPLAFLPVVVIFGVLLDGKLLNLPLQGQDVGTLVVQPVGSGLHNCAAMYAAVVLIPAVKAHQALGLDLNFAQQIRKIIDRHIAPSYFPRRRSLKGARRLRATTYSDIM